MEEDKDIPYVCLAKEAFEMCVYSMLRDDPARRTSTIHNK